MSFSLFVGVDLKSDHESQFFLRVNEWVLRQSNSTWGNPYNMNFIDKHFIDNAVRVIEEHINSFKIVKYMGLRIFLSFYGRSSIEGAWGWKDPRSTVTMDVWKRLYPGAKVVHIYRNPIDVACSLKYREEKTRIQPLEIRSKLKERLFVGKSSFSSSVRILDLYQGVSLWSEYTTKALKLSNDMDVENIRYESFLEDPVKYLRSILEFIRIGVNQELPVRLAAKVNKERSFAFLNDEELIEIYHEILPIHESVLSECNYTSLI